MSADKLVDSTQLDSDLTSVANAIRTKGGTSASLAFPADFVSAIAAIPSGGGGLKYDTGTFTPASDNSDARTISHNLGEVPDVVIVWTNFFDGGANLPASKGSCFGCIWLRNIVDIPQRLSSSASSSYPLFCNIYISSGNSTVTVATPSSDSYTPKSGTVPTSSVFYAWKQGNTTYWRAGATYKYFVAKKWW